MDKIFEPTAIPGCFIYQSRLFTDHRGTFLKMYSQEVFRQQGLNVPLAEVYFSSSHKGVIRGMHFQVPPHDHAKIVTCISGRILDVILDLRKSSPMYGKALGVELSPSSNKSLFIPRGCAHGFYSYEDNSLVCYAVETDHNKESDQGILWNSFGFNWPGSEPVLSERDQAFPGFSQFESPFA